MTKARIFMTVVWVGLAVVLAAAAVLSFDALRHLAVTVRIPETIAWLLPISIDAGAAVSCAVWLGGWSAPAAARFAGRMTWALLAATVLGNATAQGMAAAAIVPPWWVAVLVGAVPPAVVGATVHLVVLLVRRAAEAPEAAVEAPETPVEAPSAAVETLEAPSERKVRIVALKADGLTAAEIGAKVGVSDRRVRQILAEAAS
jgi:hypothetical protein